MKKKGWHFVLITPKSLSRVRQTYLGINALLVFKILSLAGLFGLFRLVWFSTSYAIAKFGVNEARRENNRLLQNVKTLDRYILKESDRLDVLVSFEDKIRLQYGLNRISDDVRQAGVGGRPSREEMLIATMLDPVLMRAEAVKESIIVLLRKAELQDSTLSQTSNLVSLQRTRWSQLPSIWPTHGRITSSFGYRFHPISKHNLFHDGIDIANKIWTPVYATANGVVKFAGVKEYFGRVIIIEHPGSNSETVYAHLHQFVTSQGKMVRRGELIGYMGNSGRSTGPHLHYEVRMAGRNVNPFSYILPSDVIVD